MSSIKKQEEQTKNICLLKKDGFTLYLVKEGDSFTDIKNGVVSILPEGLIAKRKSGGNISTDIENYAHKLKRQEYGKKLNYQIENLLFLTGAGSSYLFGENDKKGKLMCHLWDDATVLLGGKQNMDAFCEKVRYTDKDEKDEYRKNLEKVLSLAEKAKDYITEPIFKTDKDEEWNITYTVSKIKKMIKDNCNLQITSSESSSVHEKFLNKITKRKSSIARVKLFTLNYDTLFEQAARKGNYTIIDGFSFSIPRIFSGRHFDYDIVIRDGSRIKNEDNFVPRVFHLYKPHGSVDWEKRGNNVYQNKAEEISVEDSLMIFPQENKYEHSYEQPFFEMMTRFQAALRMKNTTLVVIGFSFGDKHILSMINEALEQNPSFQLIIINYRDTGIIESDIFYKEAGERGNIMMVNETFKEFVDAYPNIKIYDQSDEYRLVKIVNEGN